ncbi:PLP-dependent aminotransferase family protein [Asticcacaulis sp. ZE23SCel15]|uniref:aminotransferase-like domain-containing protein n=1 Tax=Asticcacaulis sp. ZE23SCel15 TaxID=3059027 RepID=UPI00265EFD39|nr:PLP-dependent aminotransferase family protein [Asticcacaulis sp. ZE23SCel15]WKL57868.1 PLP-dependent aminotransferase family protein [Asticcacaulis sp. ZE23SCel15]
MAFDLTLTQQVMTVIRDQIARRQLSAGARLPSIRAFAEAQKVSKSTVVEAYDRLLAEGVITARRGSGYYVASAFAPLSLAEIGPRLDRQVDPLWVSRQSLETRDYLKPGCGWLPASWMPEDDIRRALRALARNPKADLLDYSTPAGHAGLRQILTRRLAEKDIDVSPGQVILMDSATQAIELLCRFLLKPGDTVLLDDPCYFNFLAKLRAHKVNVVGVPYTPNGPDMAALTTALETHRPRLYLTNTSMHNPTGASLSPINAHRLLKLAEAYDLTIIEDDIYSDFELEPGPRLSAFDGFERVVYVGGFSKALSASIRLGYIAARSDWIEALTDLKIATLFSSQTFAAELVCQVLSDGHYRKHLDTLRQKLAAVRGPTAERLEKLGLKTWLRPQAGMFLWCELPEGYDASDLARQALNERIVLAPGNAFSVNQTATRFMRFNIAQSQDERLFAFLKSHLRT